MSDNTAIFMLQEDAGGEERFPPSVIGAKAYNLIICDRHHLPIPKSIICATEILNVPEKQLALLTSCKEYLEGETYIMRSSYPSEDGTRISNAGKFLSRICQGDTIITAMQEIHNHATAHGETLPSYVLIQPYIPAKTSGILCTLDPLQYMWGQRLVSGTGDNRKHVDGSSDTTTSYIDRNNPVITIGAYGMQCESIFGYPQDIERVIDMHDRLWIVQSRPITTLQNFDQETINMFDEFHMQHTAPYHLVKNTFGLTGDTISTSSLQCIQDLYRYALAQHYAELRVPYTYTQYIVTVAGTIYTDIVKEKNALMSCAGNGRGFPALKQKCRIWRGTLQRYLHPEEIIEKFHTIYTEMRTHLLTPGGVTYDEVYGKVLHAWYPLIFTISLCYGNKSHTAFSATSTLSTYRTFQSNMYKELETMQLIGNSINIDDTTPFVHTVLTNPKATLREHLKNDSRILVAYMTTLLHAYGYTPQGNKYKKNIGPEHICSPVCLSTNHEGIICCSEGRAEGILYYGIDTIPEGKPIIYVDELNPTLVEIFPCISGIIARRGSELSHLAIVARELCMPVISGVTENILTPYMSKHIIIDTNNKNTSISIQQ